MQELIGNQIEQFLIATKTTVAKWFGQSYTKSVCMYDWLPRM